MYWSPKQRVFLQLVTVLTLMAFFPSSVSAWNFTPERVKVANVPASSSPIAGEVAQDADQVPAEPVSQPVSDGQVQAPPPMQEDVTQASDPPAPPAEAPATSPVKKLPSPGELLEHLKAQLPAKAGDVKLAGLTVVQGERKEPSVRITGAGGAAVTATIPEAVAQAKGIEDTGNYAKAVFGYMGVLDSAPRSTDSVYADAYLGALLDAGFAGGFSPEDMDAIEATLPAVEDLKTVESSYAVLDFLSRRAKASASAKDDAGAKDYHTRCLAAADAAFNKDAEHPLQLAVAKKLYESAKSLGVGQSRAAADRLRGLVEGLKPCAARWGARFMLAEHLNNVERSIGDSYLQYFDMVGDLGDGLLDAVRNDENTYPWVKALAEYYVGYAYQCSCREEQALVQYDLIVKQYEGCGMVYDEAFFAKAAILCEMYRDDPAQGLAVYQEYVDKYPTGPLVDMTLMAMVATYMRHQNFSSAGEIASFIVQNYPGTVAASDAERTLKNLVDTGMLENQATSDETPAVTADARKMCGPYALARFLEAKGVEADSEELARLAETDETGTTMLGLVRAASAKGVTLTGVETDDPATLATPYIALVHDAHFVLVRSTEAQQLLVADMNRPEEYVSRDKFMGVWSGKALVSQNTEKVAMLTEAVLSDLKGGEEPDCPNQYIPPSCSAGGGGSGPGGGGGNQNGGGGGDAPPTPPGEGGPPVYCVQAPCGRMANGAPGSPSAQASFAGSPSLVMGSSFQPFMTAQNFSDVDISFGIRGGSSIVFSRLYANPAGWKRAETYGSKPWQDNIGEGWIHSFNTYLKTSATVNGDGAPLTVVVREQTGNLKYYLYSHRANVGGTNYDYYFSSSNGLYQDRGNRLIRNASTQAFVFEFAAGGKLNFTAPTADVDRFCRLEFKEDVAGNVISCTYDGANGTGKLTKILAPSGDGRYIQLSYRAGWNGWNQITKAELKNASGTIYQVGYDYNNYNGNLTKITDNDGQCVKYSYYWDADPDNWLKHYVTTRKDKLENTTTYSCDYGPNYWGTAAYRLTMTTPTPDSLVTVYERNLFMTPDYSTYCTAVNSYQGTQLRRIYYSEGLHGYYIGCTFYYKNPGDALFNEWNVHYYDANDALTKVKDFNGRYAEYTYTPTKGRLSTATYHGKTVRWHYANANALYPTRVTNANGLDTYYYYDVQWRTTKVTHPWVNTANGYQYAYDEYGNLTRAADPSGNATTMAYDACGNLTSVTNALNQTQTMAYDARGRVTQTTDPLNKSTYNFYSDGCGGCGGGGLTKVRDALGNETEFRYDKAGHLTAFVDAFDREIAYSYDCMGRITQVMPPGCAIPMAFTYDRLGQMITKQDLGGATTVYGYDHMGRTTTVTTGGQSHSYGYDLLGNLTSVTDPAGHTTYNAYDANERLTKVTDPIGKITRYFYDSAGRVITTGAGTNGTFDPVYNYYHPTTGLLNKVYFVNSQTYNNEVTYAYDANARLTNVNDWMGGTVMDAGHFFEYDALGRVTRYRDFDDNPSGTRKKVDYVYDAVGHVVTMTDYEGNVTAYTYTDTGQLSTITAAGGKTWDYDCNALGQPTQVSLPNGTATAYAYDNRNRMTKIEHKDGSTVMDGWTYALDDGGSISRITDASGDYWDYYYDGRHRLITAERNNSGATIKATYKYSYGPAGNIFSKIEPFNDDFNDGDYSGWTTAGTWDATNHHLTKSAQATARLDKANTDGDVEMWFSYCKDDTLTTSYLQAAVRSVDDYNYTSLVVTGSQLQLKMVVAGVSTYVTNATATTTVGQWYDVRIKCNGSNITIWRKARGQSAEYQQVLTTSSAPTYSPVRVRFYLNADARFKMDDIRIVSDSLATNHSLSYNWANELTSHTVDSTSGGAATNYTYDDWGRMITKNVQSGAHIATYRYRFGSKLKEISSTCPDETAATSILYDGLGKRRVVYTFTGGYTWYRWDMGYHRLAKYADTNTDWYPEGTVETYVPNPNSRIGELAKVNSGTYSYYYGDHLGSIRRMRDQSKASLAKYEFDPYGGAYSIEGQALDYGYTGHTWDDETGLYYAAYRYYNPTTARWNMRDPLGMKDGPNLYAYGQGNPVRRLDPLGLACTPWYEIFSHDYPMVLKSDITDINLFDTSLDDGPPHWVCLYERFKVWMGKHYLLEGKLCLDSVCPLRYHKEERETIWYNYSYEYTTKVVDASYDVSSQQWYCPPDPDYPI